MARAGSRPFFVAFVGAYFLALLSANNAALIKPEAQSEDGQQIVGSRAIESKVIVANYQDAKESEEPIFIPATNDCGGTYIGGFSGTFGSPNYPENYYDNLFCEYYIEVRSGYWIRLNFTSFTTETNLDIVRVYGAENSQSNFTHSYSGVGIPPVQISRSNWMRVTFSTDRSVTSRGWQAIYERLDGSECGAELGGLSGSFASPRYPGPYDTGADCLYSIDVSLGHAVDLNFTDFSLASGDYVYVYDGPTLQDSYNRYTGVSLPPRFSSSSHQVLVRLTSSSTGNSAGNYHGFLASFVRV